MRKKELEHFYNKNFYKAQVHGSTRSARIILGMLFQVYRPKSVIDVGCGVGSWLFVAESFGCKVLSGLDGHWINEKSLLSKNVHFKKVNFEEDFTITNKYDLAISVEVAEHIPESRAKLFVKTLCDTSDVVLFSAAIRDQGGVNHINEQWQSYWIALFDSNGYECFDSFRSAIWNNDQIELCYRQNIFLFVNSENENMPIERELLKTWERPIPDVVHPGVFEIKSKLINEPSLRVCLSIIKRYICRMFKVG